MLPASRPAASVEPAPGSAWSWSWSPSPTAGQTHPTAFTKNELGWLDAAAIPRHEGESAEYELQHINLAQPPPAGRAATVRVGDGFPYVMVEARKMTDQFEAGMPSTSDPQERGIASEGVIAYLIQTRNPTVQEREGNKLPLYLMTQTALQPDQLVGRATVLGEDGTPAFVGPPFRIVGVGDTRS